MLSLASVGEKFDIRFEIIENGSGTFSGIIDEVPMNQSASANFSLPRRLLRVTAQLAILAGMVVRSQAGAVYIVGEHGESESFESTVFKSFRLFGTHDKFSVKRSVKTIDLVTNLPVTDGEPTEVANIWGTYEPLPELFDRETRISQETARFVTNYPIQMGDIVAGKRVFRVDKQLGLYIATLD